MDDFPASKVHLQPIGNWVWSKGEKFTPSKRKGGEGGRLKNSKYQLFWAQNPLRHPELSISQHDFPSKDTITYLSYLISLNIPAILDLSLNICLVFLNPELLPMAIEHFLYAHLSYGMNCLFSCACRQIYKHLNQD